MTRFTLSSLVMLQLKTICTPEFPICTFCTDCLVCSMYLMLISLLVLLLSLDMMCIAGLCHIIQHMYTPGLGGEGRGLAS